MDEALVRGLVIGAFFGILGLIANVVWKIVRSESEGARRIKIVGGVALVLLIGSILVSGFGVGGAIGTAVVIGAMVWVFKGFKGTSLPAEKKPTPKTEFNRPEVDATEFKTVDEVLVERKTVITCPNCSGRLRVVAGKYIDVTCPHCKTIFRTHT